MTASGPFDWPPRPPQGARHGSRRVREVVRRFALEHGSARKNRVAIEAGSQAGSSPDLIRGVLPPPGTIALLSGASGSGKSTLLRAAVAEARRDRVRVIDLAAIEWPGSGVRRVVDCVGPGRSLDEALRRLARVGLAETWTWLRRPGELSEGQAWRLRLAMAIDRAAHAPAPIDDRSVVNAPASPSPAEAGPAAAPATAPAATILACDEFAALLDRVTAVVVARALRHAIDESNGALAAIVVTSHDDLAGALAPDRIARCDFGTVEIHTREATR